MKLREGFGWRCSLCPVRGSGVTAEWALRRWAHHYRSRHQGKP